MNFKVFVVKFFILYLLCWLFNRLGREKPRSIWLPDLESNAQLGSRMQLNFGIRTWESNVVTPSPSRKDNRKLDLEVERSARL